MFRSEALKDLLRKSLSNFGDSFYIKHTPIPTQEGLLSLKPVWLRSTG